MKNSPYIRGFSLLSVIVGTVIIGGTVWYASSSYSQLKKTRLEIADKVLANAYATELLEVFRSYPAKELLDYLASSSSAAVPLCAHLNILDRSSGSIVNPDPIAALPVNRLDRNTPHRKSNRFFQVSVVNMDTLEVKTSPYCNLSPGSAPALSASERVLVTVGVSWPSRANRGESISRVVMSTVLPR